MIFTAPLGFLALLAVPAIVALHLFRRRFPPRNVAGLFLWQVVRQVPEGGGKVTKLPITRSLILECLAALALAMILAGARFAPSSVNQYLVVLLDDTASMSAMNAQGESPRDRAVRRVLDEIGNMNADARITIVLSGERPAVLLGPAALAIEAASALEKWRPRAMHHSFDLGLRLARELAKDTGRIMALSDAPANSGKDGRADGVLWLSVGQSLPNAGITAGERTTTGLSITLGNFSESNARRNLRVVSGQNEIMTREIDFPTGSSSMNLPLPRGLGPVRVELSSDAMPRDNEVVLVEPRPQFVGADNRLPEGRGRQALSKALAAVAGVTEARDSHLAFVPAAELDKPAAGGVWRVGFAGAGSGKSMDYAAPFLIEKRHPLVQGISLAGVIWTGASPIAGRNMHPLISAGDQPLVALAGAGPESGILFNLDLDRTNLVRSPDWPILISNLVELRRQDLPGPERWNYRIGEWVRVRLGRAPKATLRFKCGDVERQLPQASLLEFTAPSPGGLLQILEGDEVLFEMGVNFMDEAEANLRDKTSGEVGAFSTQAAGFQSESGPASDPLFWVLLAIAGVSIVANWWLLE